MKILVIGSSNTDMVVQSPRLPMPGETVLGRQFVMNPGGKGANQAVAATRLGGSVRLLAKLGDDPFGRQAISQLQREGILTDYILIDPNHPSGVALITVDEQGENSIVVASGANMALATAEIANAQTAFAQAELMPNQTEAQRLTDVRVDSLETAHLAAQKLCDRGVANVVITLGKEGAYLYNEQIAQLIPSYPVKAVDTTAAGDTFNGALAVALSQGKELYDAIAFANLAASFTVTRLGAQSSMPYRSEIKG